MKAGFQDFRAVLATNTDLFIVLTISGFGGVLQRSVTQKFGVYICITTVPRSGFTITSRKLAGQYVASGINYLWMGGARIITINNQPLLIW